MKWKRNEKINSSKWASTRSGRPRTTSEIVWGRSRKSMVSFPEDFEWAVNHLLPIRWHHSDTQTDKLSNSHVTQQGKHSHIALMHIFYLCTSTFLNDTVILDVTQGATVSSWCTFIYVFHQLLKFLRKQGFFHPI